MSVAAARPGGLLAASGPAGPTAPPRGGTGGGAAAPARPATGSPAVALAPVRSLGVVPAGCPVCHRFLGLAGAEGLELAVAAHRRGCPASRPAPTRPGHYHRRRGAWAGEDVCGGCGCEAALYVHGAGRRCGDCLAALRLELPA